MEIEKRRTNLIIVNLKESSKKKEDDREKEDTKSVKALLGKMVKLEDGDLKEPPVRLGSQGDKPRIIKVVLNSEKKKREIMKKAPSMNEKVPLEKRVYINQDYTKRQREAHKALRDELKDRQRKGEKNIAIRGKQIVKVIPKPRTVDEDGESSDDDTSGDDDDDEEENEKSDSGDSTGEEEEAKDDDDEELVAAASLFD